ncbi:trigger factor [Dethiosulfatarculus sandiegensis]|uniref:Trigger factor n=1 Tax=Dethiosulfatarculus sandiegensis TaxID=1429043 RepID=A0A0D2HRF6_9BACT|nr:trigger factor [Dethiosulfatarculus sandiegensis]KIX13148.1 hypothetical protein X474_15395 [Dethiosulfatarculus sandiegensis]
MKVNTEELSSVERLLTVEIPAAEVKKTLDKIYKAIKRQAKIRGFRPGKAPRSVLEKYYGDRAASEAVESLIGDSYADALKEADVNPIAQPEFDFEPPEEGKDFIYKITLDILPEFELDPKEYKGLELKEPDMEVTDDIVNERLDSLRERQSVLIPLEEERPSATGDVVVVNYESYLEGEKVDGGQAENVEVELGKGSVQEEIEVALVKVKPGDIVEATVSYDENVSDPKLQGKDVVFKLFVKELKVKVLPELDDDFARSVSPEFENLETLKERIKTDLEDSYQDQKDSALRSQIMDQIRDLGEFDVPKSLVREEAGRMVESLKNQLRQSGMDPDKANLDHAKMVEDFSGSAENKVRSGIVLGKISDIEKVEVEDSDIDAEMEKLSRRIGQPAKAIKEMHIKNNMMDSLKARLTEEKTLQALKADAIIKKADPSELAKELEEKAKATQSANETDE